MRPARQRERSTVHRHLPPLPPRLGWPAPRGESGERAIAASGSVSLGHTRPLIVSFSGHVTWLRSLVSSANKQFRRGCISKVNFIRFFAEPGSYQPKVDKTAPKTHKRLQERMGNTPPENPDEELRLGHLAQRQVAAWEIQLPPSDQTRGRDRPAPNQRQSITCTGAAPIDKPSDMNMSDGDLMGDDIMGLGEVRTPPPLATWSRQQPLRPPGVSGPGISTRTMPPPASQPDLVCPVERHTAPSPSACSLIMVCLRYPSCAQCLS